MSWRICHSQGEAPVMHVGISPLAPKMVLKSSVKRVSDALNGVYKEGRCRCCYQRLSAVTCHLRSSSCTPQSRPSDRWCAAASPTMGDLDIQRKLGKSHHREPTILKIFLQTPGDIVPGPLRLQYIACECLPASSGHQRTRMH